MKKILISILILNLIIYILCGCQNQVLSIPEYPLTTHTIERALKDNGITCTIQEDDWVLKEREGKSLHNLYSTENEDFFSGISSGIKDGERLLYISFPPPHFNNTISLNESENLIFFATNLFGGFKNESQVYNSFINEYDTANHDGELYWEGNIDGIICQIRLEQSKLDDSQEYLSVIVLASDWDTFFSE